jgi:nitrite reductase/ring-hydroxylating ferredoxin subunit
MFRGLANVWTPVEAARRVRRRPVRVTVAGERIALFRGPGGKVAALYDQCPHRGAPLSRGRIVQGGSLQCPYHGWQFAASGACTRLPLSPQPSATELDRYAATAFAAEESGGLVWLYTGLRERAPAFEPPPSLAGSQRRSTVLRMTWRAHWTRVMENSLDLSHGAHVHAGSVARSIQGHVRGGAVMRAVITPTSSGLRAFADLDGLRSSSFEWHKPTLARFCTDSRHDVWWHIIAVPIDGDCTRVFFVRSSPGLAVSKGGLKRDAWVLWTIPEDRAIVESLPPGPIPPAHEEVSVANDAPPLCFRKYYLRELKDSSAETMRTSGTCRRRLSDLGDS